MAGLRADLVLECGDLGFEHLAGFPGAFAQAIDQGPALDVQQFVDDAELFGDPSGDAVHLGGDFPVHGFAAPREHRFDPAQALLDPGRQAVRLILDAVRDGLALADDRRAERVEPGREGLVDPVAMRADGRDRFGRGFGEACCGAIR